MMDAIKKADLTARMVTAHAIVRRKQGEIDQLKHEIDELEKLAESLRKMIEE